MKEIIEAINRLIDTINQNSTPAWVTYVGIFVPISISVTVAILSWFQNKKSNELQKEIEESSKNFQSALNNHEEYVQMRDNFLKIYDDFGSAQSILVHMSKRVHIIFSNFTAINGYSEPYQLICDIKSTANIICRAVNRASLLPPREDKDFRSILHNIHEKYLILCEKISSYFYNNHALMTSENAWDLITKSSNIARYDYSTLTKNPPLYDNYLRLCDTDETKEIEKLIEELLPLFEYEKFDKYFEPYLQMISVERKFDNVSDK